MQDENISQSSLPQIPCMVLCAGTSARFGQDKMLVDLAGKPVVAHVLERLGSQTETLALNAPMNGAYSQFNLPVLEDCLEGGHEGGLGPLVGVLTAMKWAASQHSTHVLTCAGDTPFIPLDWVARLQGQVSDGIVVSQSTGRRHHICTLWPTGLADPLQRDIQAGMRGVGRWIAQHKSASVIFDTNGDIDSFFNINTPEDFIQAEAHVRTFRNGS